MNITQERLIKLISESGKTRKEIAKGIEGTEAAIAKHVGGERKVNPEYIVKYAKYFNVSCDYLLGLTNVATVNTDLRNICDYTGLSEKAVNNLNVLSKACGAFNPLKTINKLIEYEDYANGSNDITESGKYVFTLINTFLHSSLDENSYYVIANGLIQNSTDKLVTSRKELESLKYVAEDGVTRDFAMKKENQEKIITNSCTPSLPAKIFENALVIEIERKLIDIKKEISDKEV